MSSSPDRAPDPAPVPTARRTRGSRGRAADSRPANEPGSESVVATPTHTARRTDAAQRDPGSTRSAVRITAEPTLGDALGQRVAVPAVARLAAVAMLCATALLMAAELTTYVVVDRGGVRAAMDGYSVAAYAVSAGVIGAATVGLLAGRGGRALLGVLLPAAALGPGRLALTWYTGRGDAAAHHVVEYYFGVGQYPGGLQPRAGWWLALAGCLLLCVGGLAVAAAWRSTGSALLPVAESARRVLVGGGVATVVLVALAHFFAPALTIRRTYQDTSGLVLTQEVPPPHAEIALLGWGAVGGVLLICGWLLVAIVLASMSTREQLFGVLAGSACAALTAGLLTARDIAAGPDLVVGPRVVVLLVAGVALAGLAWWSASGRSGHARADT